MIRFLDRADELRRLDRYWASGRAELIVLTGRRRVGKSLLLAEHFRAKPHIHVVGTAQTRRVQLGDVSREVARATGDPLLASQSLDSWDAILAYLGQYGQTQRVGVVIDEFSYFVDQAPELPSLIQRWWDRTGVRTQIVLVLASSHVGYMDRLLSGEQPLFGRRTGDLRLEPFDYADAARFFPDYDPSDRLRAYGVFGGMPAYLSAYNPDVPLADNVRERILESDASLRSEPLYLLAQERSVMQPAAYLSILRAIADGQTQPNLIVQAAGFRTPAAIAPYLQRLQEFRLIERLVPITAEAPSRISRYIITDPFLAFWFRFVQPAESLLQRGLPEPVLVEVFTGPHGLDHFISRAQGPWERACADYLWRALRAGALSGIEFDRLGPWWAGRSRQPAAEIDLVGLQGNRPTLLASCKWRNEWLTIGDLIDLRRVAPLVNATAETPCVLFSRSGFDPSLVRLSESEPVVLIGPDEMFDSTIVAHR